MSDFGEPLSRAQAEGLSRTAKVERILKETGAVMEGHFLLASGRHSPTYLEKFQILQHPEHTEALCRMIAQHFRGWGIEVVAGPTMGGIILAFEVARHLRARAIYAEREGEGRAFRRGLTLFPGERVLVVDDVLTTGGSVREVMAAVREIGGGVVGVGVLVDRAQGEIDLGVPLYGCYPLVHTQLPAGGMPTVPGRAAPGEARQRCLPAGPG